jgi:uncharacterized protein YbjT (DUF2867 family)
MFIVINTPNGNIGRVVAQKLVGAGEYTALLTRHADRVSGFARAGATTFEGDLLDWNFVSEATRGCERLFWATPQAYDQPDLLDFQVRLGRNLARAIRENEIGWVLNVSTIGAQHPAGTGAIQGLREVEQLLDDSPANVLHLRASYFMENFLHSMQAIQEEGAINLPVDGAVQTSMIATADVANLAANLLCEPDWVGHSVREVVGPRWRSFDDAAGVFSEVLGREIRHVRISPERAKQGMLRRGWSPRSAELIVEMYEAMGAGLLTPVDTPLIAPTTLRCFVKTKVLSQQEAQA